MKAWLIVNSYLNNLKFKTLYEMLENSMNNLGIGLEIKTGYEIARDLGSMYRLKKELGKGVFPDFCIFWDKDIYLAEILESQGLRLFNSKDAIEMTDNKILTYLKLQREGIRIPKTYIPPKRFSPTDRSNYKLIEKIKSIFVFPLVLKEAYGSFGEQVYLIKDVQDLYRKLKEMGNREFLIQEFIRETRGRDVRVNVVGEKVVASILRENPNDFRSNITSGGKMKKYEPDKPFKDLALAASRALGLDFAGVDILFGSDGPIICEVNSNPHFYTTYQATGVDLSREIGLYIIKEMKKFKGGLYDKGNLDI